MLGRLGFGKPTTLDALLDSRRVVLEDILDMEDCLDQVRMRHKKLIEYIRQPLILSQLIRYLVLGEKYAWLVSEIMASTIPAIMDVLVYQHKELLTVYWALLYQNYRLTQQQVVYFVKVNQALLTRRPGDMIQFISCLSDLLPQWIYHMGDPQGSQLADLLVSLVQCELNAEDTGIIKWLHQHGLIQLLVEQLDASVDPMMHSIAQQILCDIVRLSQTSHQEMATIGTNDLIADLSSKETMTRLLDIMLDTSGLNAIDSFICGAKLLINLIRYNDERHLEDTPLSDTSDISTNSKILANILICCTSRLEDFLYLLENPRSKQPARLGMERLVLLELIAEWIHCANLTGVYQEGDAFKSAYCQYDAVGRVLDLFFAFPSCNLAHSVICDMIGQTFENKCLQRETNQQMILEVFTKAQLIHRILDVNKQMETENDRSKVQLGYMGHLTLMTKSIVQILHTQPDLLKILRNGEDTSGCIPWDEWDTYAAMMMDQCAELALPLGGKCLPSSSPVIPKSTFPAPPPPIHIPSSAPPSPRSTSLPSPSLSPLSSPLLPIELVVDAR
ncbi:SIT4 phosphatase-associated protein-domain-containing protein [Absidia repens]|uniref:SIT4 phosphatase-associated protein-domain-containing protein n=1 Tax=Absidia repens TaxID=90262 RepID=A0A1X2J0A8_9FUNG|nr:SIT4 phosphatase-associated protein-domain-containing protein [Absidia repens]